MKIENWDNATYPNPPTPNTSLSQKNGHSCDFLAGIDADTGELVTVGEWASASDAVGGGLIFLEQLHAKGCQTRNRPVMIGRNFATKKAVVFRPRCKLWSCPSCAKTNSDLWCMRVTMGCQQFIDQGLELSFVTVTSHEQLSAKESVEVLPHSWKKLSMRLRRHVKGLKYVVIPERHKTGRVHIHGIFLSGANKRWWKDNARSCGMGYQAEEEAVYSASGAGFYVGKYLAKQLSDARWKKGFRRVRTSLYFPKLQALPRHPNWDFAVISGQKAVSEHIRQLQATGISIAMADHCTAWALVEQFSTP